MNSVKRIDPVLKKVQGAGTQRVFGPRIHSTVCNGIRLKLWFASDHGLGYFPAGPFTAELKPGRALPGETGGTDAYPVPNSAIFIFDKVEHRGIGIAGIGYGSVVIAP